MRRGATAGPALVALAACATAPDPPSTATLSGTVLLADRVVAVQVCFVPGPCTHTDATGAFRLPDLPMGQQGEITWSTADAPVHRTPVALHEDRRVSWELVPRRDLDAAGVSFAGRGAVVLYVDGDVPSPANVRVAGRTPRFLHRTDRYEVSDAPTPDRLLLFDDLPAGLHALDAPGLSCRPVSAWGRGGDVVLPVTAGSLTDASVTCVPAEAPQARPGEGRL